MAVLPSAASTVSANVETSNFALPDAWVTVIVFELVPVHETVTMAVRWVIVVFSFAEMVTEPFPEPVAGVNVNHAWEEDTLHGAFDKTENDALLPSAEGIVSVVFETSSVAVPDAWVTVIIFAETPVAETVMVAVRSFIVLFSSAVSVIDELPEPVATFAIIHD